MKEDNMFPTNTPTSNPTFEDNTNLKIILIKCIRIL